MSTNSADAATPRALVDVGPGHPGRGDPVAAAVAGDEVASGERRDRVAAAPARARARRRRRRWVVGHVHGRARAHGVAEQHDRARPGAPRRRWSSAQRASGTGEGSGPVPAFQPRTPKRSSHSDRPSSSTRGSRTSRIAVGTPQRGAAAARRASSPAFAPPCSISTMPRGGGRGRVRVESAGEGHAVTHDRVQARCFGAVAGNGWDGRRDRCRRDTARWARDGNADLQRQHRRAGPAGRPAPGAPRSGRGGRGRPLALLRPGRPDALRRRLRREDAPARGARGARSPTSARPTRRRRRSAARSPPSSPRSTTSSGWRASTTRSPTRSSRRGRPAWPATGSPTRPTCASSRSTGSRSTCSTRRAASSARSPAATAAPARTSRPTSRRSTRSRTG